MKWPQDALWDQQTVLGSRFSSALGRPTPSIPGPTRRNYPVEIRGVFAGFTSF